MKTIVVLTAATLAVAAGILLVIYSPSGLTSPPSYIAFSRHRSLDYYCRIADACADLISKARSTQTNGLRFKGDDPILPQALRDLKSKDVSVFTNRVNLFIDAQARYSVGWEKDEANPKVWHLLAYGEGEPVTLLTRTNK